MADFFTKPNDSDSIQRYTTLLAWMFSSIKLSRGSASNDTYEIVELPVIVTGGQVYHKAQRLKLDADAVTRYRNILPRAGLEFVGVVRDPQRLTNRHAVIHNRLPDAPRSQDNRTAYNFNFRLNCKVKTRSEAYQLIELISLRFNPYVAITVNDSKAVGIKQDITIELADVGYEDNWEGSFEEAREIIVPFDFTVKGYIYDNTDEAHLTHTVLVDLDADGTLFPSWIVARET